MARNLPISSRMIDRILLAVSYRSPPWPEDRNAGGLLFGLAPQTGRILSPKQIIRRVLEIAREEWATDTPPRGSGEDSR